MDYSKNLVLGMDLGTTFSSVGQWDGRGVVILEDITGKEAIQSVVYYEEPQDAFTVGETAYNKTLKNPEYGVIGVKRMMDDGEQPIRLGTKTLTPVEVSSEILKRWKSDALSKVPGSKVSSSVVTVPYYFKVHQCENTRKAAELSNINCKAILQEPIAASIGYAWYLSQKHGNQDYSETILVFDLGGGTFDLTLFQLHLTATKIRFEVLATGGDDRLGGMDFDERIVELFLKRSGSTLDGLEPKAYRMARQKLLERANSTKITLTTSVTDTVTISDVVPGKGADFDVSQADLEEILGDYIKRIEDMISHIWSDAGIQPHEVPKKLDRVIKVGGSSKLACIRKMLERVIGKDKIYNDIKDVTAVAQGAAIYAAYLDDPEVLGKEVEIVTRTCHSLGVETTGGKFHVLVPANRPAPCEIMQIFRTDADNVTNLDINLFQGSSKQVADNSLVGTIKVDGLKPRPKGETKVKITLKVSPQQTLSVLVDIDGQRSVGNFKIA